MVGKTSTSPTRRRSNPLSRERGHGFLRNGQVIVFTDGDERCGRRERVPRLPEHIPRARHDDRLHHRQSCWLEATRTGTTASRRRSRRLSLSRLAFTVKVRDPSGTYLANYPFNSPSPRPRAASLSPDYTKITGTLSVGASVARERQPLSTGVSRSYATYDSSRAARTMSGSAALHLRRDRHRSASSRRSDAADAACSVYGTQAHWHALLQARARLRVPGTRRARRVPCVIPRTRPQGLCGEGDATTNATPVTGVLVAFTSDDFVKPVRDHGRRS